LPSDENWSREEIKPKPRVQTAKPVSRFHLYSPVTDTRYPLKSENKKRDERIRMLLQERKQDSKKERRTRRS